MTLDAATRRGSTTEEVVEPLHVRAPADGVRVAAALAALVWVGLLVHGGVEHVGRFAARPAAAAAACGIALLVTATKPLERDARDAVTLAVVWAATTLGVVGGVGDPSVIPLAIGLGVAVVAVAVGHGRDRTLQTAIVTAGAALVVGAVAVAGEHAARFDATAFAGSPVAVGVAIAGAVVVLVGALDGDGPTVLAVPALAVAAVVAPHAGAPAALVVPTGLVAVTAAWFDRRALAVALAAVAALAVTTHAGLLLAAAAVVVVAVPSSAALLAAAPGAVVLATTATHDPTVASVAAAFTVAAVALLLTVGRDLRPTTIPLRSALAAVAGVHLALAPTTWGWTGTNAAGELAHWSRGAALALAGGLLAAVVAVQSGAAPFPRRDPHEPATDAEPPTTGIATDDGDDRWRTARVAALAALGLAAAALVRSSLRSVH